MGNPGIPVEMSGVLVEKGGPEKNVPLEDMPCVLETSVPASVGTWEEMAIVSAAELMGWEGLVSLRLGLLEDAGSVPDQVVSEETGTGEETLVSLVMEGLNTGEVTSGGPDSAGAEECGSCPELLDRTLVSVVCPEDR
uniref:Uncharacterized protein n=1 Tax=Pipistrellus kuhlii TaxID=59472 RepID=A0A7J7TAI7_PIPKU|nr:hypothetical protein mPipKuh1_009687 [Pipistrellus kuhlii]